MASGTPALFAAARRVPTGRHGAFVDRRRHCTERSESGWAAVAQLPAFHTLDANAARPHSTHCGHSLISASSIAMAPSLMQLAASLALQSVQPSGTSVPTFCEVASDPTAYLGRTFTFEGELSFTYHHDVIAVPPCNRRIVFAWDRNEPRFRRLGRLSGRAEMGMYSITARVTGVLQSVDGGPFQDLGVMTLTDVEIGHRTRRQRASD